MKTFVLVENIQNYSILEASIREIAAELWSKGWSEKSASNFSIQLVLNENAGQPGKEWGLDDPVPHIAGRYFYITSTGSRMIDVSQKPTEYGVVIGINESGTAYRMVYTPHESVRPSSELMSHLLVHDLVASRGGREKVVLHTHATELIAITHYRGITGAEDLNNLLWSMQPGTMYFNSKGVGFVPYVLPGSAEIARITRDSFQDHDIVVWQKHGAFAIGTTLQEAFDGICIVSKSAQIWMQCRAAGFDPEGLTKEELAELRQAVK